jgi:lipopolysaccharide export system permease protein
MPATTNNEFIRLGFKEYTKQFDLSSLQFQRTSDSAANRSNWRMLSMRQLQKVIDSMERQQAEVTERVQNEVFVHTSFAKYLDSNWSTIQ